MDRGKDITTLKRFAALDRRFEEQLPLNIPIWVFEGSNDTVSPECGKHWESLTSALCSTVIIDGGHYLASTHTKDVRLKIVC